MFMYTGMRRCAGTPVRQRRVLATAQLSAAAGAAALQCRRPMIMLSSSPDTGHNINCTSCACAQKY